MFEGGAGATVNIFLPLWFGIQDLLLPWCSLAHGRLQSLSVKCGVQPVLLIPNVPEENGVKYSVS